MPVTGDVIRAALTAVGAPLNKLVSTPEELAVGADGALRAAPAGLTAEGAAAFLATCAQESAYFRTTTEYGSGQRYAPYIGRTFTQITWEANYRDFGRWCHARGLVSDPEVFVKNPKSLGDLRWAWLGPIQYWEENGIWRWANAGQFREVSQAINGGNGRVGTSFTPHGWTERQKMYAAFRKAGSALLPSGTPTSAATSTTYTVQRGDTLSGIAARYPGVTWQALAALNALADPDRLAEGQVLRIPSQASAPTPAVVPAPVEDDLPTPADVWQHPIDDPYSPQVGDTQPAHVILAFLGANAAHAANASRAALTELAGLRVAVERLAGAIGTAQGIDPEQLKAAVREAITESVHVTGDLQVTKR